MFDKYYVYRPMLDLIGFTEGTDKCDGYNETLRYGIMLDGRVTKGKGTDVVLTSMTLDQVDKMQTRMLKDPDNRKLNSSAGGRYQIVRTTMRAIRKTLGLTGAELFDADMQDRMACFLLGQRGIDKYLAGRLSEDTLIDNLAHEWASLPLVNGKGAYGGQHAAVKPSRVRAVLAEVKQRHREGQPVTTVKVDKPVVPHEVDREVKQKSNWLTSIFGGGGIVGGAAAFLRDADWQTIALIGGGGLVAGALTLIAGVWIVRRIKRIRQEWEVG